MEFSLRFIIYTIVFVSIFLFTSIVLIVWYWKNIKNRFKLLFQRRNYYKVYFNYPNGQVEWQPMSLDDNSQFNFKGCVYDFDQDAVRYEKNIPVISYYYNIPHPINYRVTKKENVELFIDGKTYKEVMKAKIIKNLVQEHQQFMIIIILLAFVALVVTVLALYQMGFLDQFINKTPKG